MIVSYLCRLEGTRRSRRQLAVINKTPAAKQFPAGVFSLDLLAVSQCLLKAKDQQFVIPLISKDLKHAQKRVAMNWVELAATGFGFLCVLLTIRRSIWCWPTGLIQVLLFTIIFYDAKLYSDVLLHVIYVFLQFYGWYYWTREDARDESLIVQSLPPSSLGFWIVVTMAGTVALGWAMARWTDASLPYPDAFTTTASLVAQFLLARRYVQNWGFWICVDIVAIWVYFMKDLNATALLYVAFLIMASIGFVIWNKQLSRQPAEEVLA